MKNYENMLQQLRFEASTIFTSAIKAVNPDQAVKRFVHVKGDSLYIGTDNKIKFKLSDYDRIISIGAGKATAPMAKAIEDLLGDRIDNGMINVKYGFTEKLEHTKITEADHPVPDQNGVEGTKKILELLQTATAKDLVFSLISGGGSALLPYPASGITLRQKQELTKELIACGASIDEINAVRKHISAVKGGQMARAAYPATTINLMLSDVVADKIDVIASGPFTPDSSSFHDVWNIINKYGLNGIPESIRTYLDSGTKGEQPETPKENDLVFRNVFNFIIGSNIIALEAAEKKARELGYQTLILSSMIEGETRDVARVHSAIAKEILMTGRPVSPPACIISGGETTVTIRGKGLGGRNQEFGLASALDLIGLPPRVVILSGGTDGNDGPTDAAGAIVDPLSVERGEIAGINAASFLQNNDAYHFLDKSQDLLITGPTNTNVMDVRLILIR